MCLVLGVQVRLHVPYADHMDELIAAATEMVERLTYMNTAQALPGDSSMTWHDHREACLDLIAELSVGLHFMAVPE